MKKILTNLVLEAMGGRAALREVLKQAILEALEDELQDEPKPTKRAKAQAEKVQAEEVAPPQTEAKPAKTKGARRKGTHVDGEEVRKLVRALADLGPHLGKSPKGTPMEEILERRAQTLVRYALPGRATQVLEGVLGYLRSLTLEDARREALRGFRDLAHAAGVGALLKPEE